ncbi:MAG TPA: cytochrome c oxidase subunit 4 [Solirubrobacteraceae bacterium]
MTGVEPEVPEAGEEIHLPGPSAQPVLLAAALAVALVGVTLSVWFVIAGLLLSLVIIVRWIQGARRDIAELPLDHDH